MGHVCCKILVFNCFRYYIASRLLLPISMETKQDPSELV